MAREFATLVFSEDGCGGYDARLTPMDVAALRPMLRPPPAAAALVCATTPRRGAGRRGTAARGVGDGEQEKGDVVWVNVCIIYFSQGYYILVVEELKFDIQVPVIFLIQLL